MITTAVVFDHRGRSEAATEGPVEVRVTNDRKSVYIPTGIKVLRRHFAGGTITGRADSVELNERLSIVYRKIQQEVNRIIDEGGVIDAVEIRRKAWKTSEEQDPDAAPLTDWIEAQLPLMNCCAGTVKHYRTFLNRLREFGRIRKWSDLTTQNIYQWDAWLHSLRKPATKRCPTPDCLGYSAVHSYHKCFKALITRAVKFGEVESNPYDKLKGVFRRGDTESVDYLAEKDVKAFMDIRPPFGSKMAAARDLFVFQLYTGLSYADTQTFDMSRYREENGKWVCVAERIKTGVPYVSRLLPPALEVLRQYNWQTPKISNADYNHCLKVIQEVADIKTTLHSHLARHTFATMMLRHGVRIENVSRMLGHTNITQTQRYAKVLAQSVREDFDMVEEKLKDIQ